jgi:hypothetical protein
MNSYIIHTAVAGFDGDGDPKIYQIDFRVEAPDAITAFTKFQNNEGEEVSSGMPVDMVVVGIDQV